MTTYLSLTFSTSLIKQTNHKSKVKYAVENDLKRRTSKWECTVLVFKSN